VSYTAAAAVSAYNVAEPRRTQAQLRILEEPKTIFRFRYETEMQGPHGMIQAKQHNKHQKVFPTVALENFDGNEEVMIRCTLHQYKNENNEEVGVLHPHKLIMRSGEVQKENEHDPHYIKVTRQNDFTAV
jgi:competence CoiA-like predicted nuclease